ncbi:hypothetical protein QQS21_006399 [Conoideocrella luteorostrata]|uniref:Uncharacterized protein n=1 Tax=Conoideocrella luteorostrata TaxID=1105319 RepID=A0AAJ0CRY6_9HYPO|nr:hypothetical protein QQS21_006399 [Conoideocrella luteorostrata]
MTKSQGLVVRLTRLSAAKPSDELVDELADMLAGNLSEEEKRYPPPSITIVPSCYDSYREKVALIEFNGGIPRFLSALADNPLCEWQVVFDNTDVSFDQRFFGFTQLYSTTSEAETTAEYVYFDQQQQSQVGSDRVMLTSRHNSIIAIRGLDGHPHGSWRGRGNLRRVWLKDFLARDLPFCRTMIYGYNSQLSSAGVEIITDYGRGSASRIEQNPKHEGSESCDTTLLKDHAS